jgi:hypothetical protein
MLGSCVYFLFVDGDSVFCFQVLVLAWAKEMK